MRIEIWEIVRARILDPLAHLRGEDDIIIRIFTTVGYAFISAIVILFSGFLMYLVTFIPLFPEVLPIIIILAIGFILAFTTVTYDDVPALSPRVWLFALGMIFFLVLLTLNAIFQLVNYIGFLGYFFYIFFMTVFLTVVFWFFSDFYAKFAGR